MKRTFIGVLMLCIMLIGTSVLASPKSDLQEIWDKQTFGDGRYQIYLDARFALFGPVGNHSILDIQTAPFFARSEDTMIMFGKAKTAVTYAVQNGDKLDLYAEEETDDKTAAPVQWLHTSVDLPTASGEKMMSMDEAKALLPEYDDVVRSVKLVDTDVQKGQLYAVTLDGRTFYQNLKKYYESSIAGAEESEASANEEYTFEMPDALSGALPAEMKEAGKEGGKIDAQMMRTFLKKVLATWKDTENIVILARVQEGEITAIQTELSPQFNAMMHVVSTAVDMKKDSEYKLGGLMEAFLRTDKMRLTVVRDGSAQYTAVPQEIIQAAEEIPIEEIMGKQSDAKPADQEAQTK